MNRSGFIRNTLCFFFLSASITFIVLALYFWQWLNTEMVIPESLREFKVESGDSLHKVSRQLQRQNLLAWPKVWVAYAKYTGSTRLHAGEFMLSESETPISLLNTFQSGKVIQYKFVIVEGSTVEQVVGDLKKVSRIEHKIESPFEPSTSKIGDLELAHLEGWFYADTYFYSAGDSDVSILERAHKKLIEILDEEWQQRAENLPYKSPYEALIMASIIEKETGAPHERAEIAGVFVRRLQKNMRLQTDPTVIYGLQREWDGNLTRADLKANHRYNTYVIKGMPPTPIALVGREAIHAALNPNDGTALYFVAKGDGTHYFSDTLDEHRSAVKQYQLNRKENYRSQFR